jgi:ferredoxin-NADP reductase
MEIEFISRINLVADIWEFTFSKPSAFNFDAGDYVELSIPNVGSRWLSMPSSPNENTLKFTLKIRQPISGFKAALQLLKPRDIVLTSPAIGNFNLPRQNKQLLFIALGLGITPYRSMLQSPEIKIFDDISLLYVAKPKEHIYESEIKSSKVKYIKHEARFASKDLLKLVPDYTKRIIFLSGPENACIKLFNELIDHGISLHQIKLEYFTGYDKI